MYYRSNNPHGGDIYTSEIQYDFSVSVNPLGTPAGVLEAMHDALDHCGCYPDPCCRRAIQAISKYEEISPDFILMGNGAADLIYSYCHVLHPKTALIPAPTFSEYENALADPCSHIIFYPLHEKDNFAVTNEILEMISQIRPDALFLCHPNNPTGQLIDPNLLDRILQNCADSNTRLFLDECFLDLTEDGMDLKKAVRNHPELFILKAFTKSFALPGIRVGYGLSSDFDLLKNMSETVQPWNVSTIAQAAAAAAVHETAFLERARQLLRTERQWMSGQLESLGFHVCPSDANYLLFRGPENLGEELRNMKIAVRSCGNFRGLGSGWYRIGLRCHEENKILADAIYHLCGKAA